MNTKYYNLSLIRNLGKMEQARRAKIERYQESEKELWIELPFLSDEQKQRWIDRLVQREEAIQELAQEIYLAKLHLIEKLTA